MTRYLLMAVLLVSCSSAGEYYLDQPEFEWVEPLIFQDNLLRCRSQDTCSVDELFN
jgi:hypothetical protein